MTKHIANILTLCRIIGSILLLFFPVFSFLFYITYIICGFTDMIDGTIARRTNSADKFGSLFDTIADLVFVLISMIRLLPSIHLPLWLLIWGIVIAVVKISIVVLVYIYKKQFFSLHTIMNKITGLLLFLLPFTLSIVDLKHGLIVVCCFATFSAIQEVFCYDE